MKDKRQNLRRHIRAAKEWLGEAEDNLAAENDIRGDLNLMLAQAELKRVTETKTAGAPQKFMMRFAPLAVAASLAAFIVLPHGTEPMREPTVPVEISEREYLPPQVHSEQTVTKNPPAKIIIDNSPQPPEETVPERLPTEENYVPPADPVLSAEDKSATYTEHNVAAQPVVTAVPDIEIQKLMQSAGKVLRSE